MTEEREVNIPLLRKAVEWVEHQAALEPWESQWRQSSWIQTDPEWFNEATDQWEKAECGTAYCVAGYVAQLVDPRFAKSQWVENKDGSSTHSSQVAGEALGLPGEYPDDHELFRAYNSAEDVRRIAEKVAGERL